MIYLDRVPRRHRAEAGQALLELALVTIFFLIFLLGVLDMGRLYITYIALTDAAEEAAVFLSIKPTCATAANCADPNNATYRARYASTENIGWEEANIEVEYPTVGKTTGNLVTVRIEYEFHLLTPIIIQIVGDDALIITAEATQVIVVE